MSSGSPTKQARQQQQRAPQADGGAADAMGASAPQQGAVRKQQQQQGATSSLAALMSSAKKKKAVAGGAHGQRVQLGAPDDDGGRSDGSNDSSDGGDDDDDESAAMQRAEEAQRFTLEEELRAARRERAEQALLMRQLQEQIQRLTTLALGSADEAREAKEQLPLLQKEEQLIASVRARRAAAGAPDDSDDEEPDDGDDARSEASARSSSSNASSAAHYHARMLRNKMAIVTPTPLVYSKASSSSALEEWIDGMELLFVQIDCVHDEARKLKELQLFTDRDIRRWWKGQQQQAVLDGAPINTWGAFVDVLRAQFLPQLESHQATSELINIRQHPGEAMEQYFLRATQIFARTNGSFSDGAAMRVVLDRVRRDEWRMALAVATREVQSGKVTTLNQLRAVLQREALAEPSRPQQSSGGGQHRAQGAHKRQSVRAAAIEQEDSGTDEEDEPSSSVHAAPVAQRAPSSSRPSFGRCLRCKKPGHRVEECKRPDERTCFLCHKKGHECRFCPLRNKKPSGGAGAASAPQKNE